MDKIKKNNAIDFAEKAYKKEAEMQKRNGLKASIKKALLENREPFKHVVESIQYIGEIRTREIEIFRLIRIKLKDEPFERIEILYWKFDSKREAKIGSDPKIFSNFRGALVDEHLFKKRFIKFHSTKKTW